MEEGVQRAFLRHTSKDYLKRGKQMKKRVSILLSFLMIFTMLFTAQLPAAALPAGTVIYVNTYDAGWDNAYIYGWDCGLNGEFVQMEKTPHQGIYSFTLPQQSPDGMIYFYFSDRNTWDGQERTESLSTQAGKNFYTIYDKDDYGKWTGRWSFVAPIEPTEPTEPPTEPPTETSTEAPTVPDIPPAKNFKLSATASRSYQDSLNVIMSTDCDYATYSINMGEEKKFVYTTEFRIYSTAYLTLRGYDQDGSLRCSKSYRYIRSNTSYNDKMIPGGTQIMFDNTMTQWDKVYLYGWNYGFFGEYILMKQIEGTNLYTYTLPGAVLINSTFCYFTNKASKEDGVRTKDIFYISAEANTVVPVVGSGPLNYTWGLNNPEMPSPYVSATSSKSFANEMDIVLSTNCDYAEYSVDGMAPISYKNNTILQINESSTIVLTGYDEEGVLVATNSYTYTRIDSTVIGSFVERYNGNLYAFLYDGDCIADGFYLMTKSKTGTYSLEFDGKARVAFATTNDRATAVWLSEAGFMLPAGSTQYFELAYPPV